MVIAVGLQNRTKAYLRNMASFIARKEKQHRSDFQKLLALLFSASNPDCLKHVDYCVSRY